MPSRVIRYLSPADYEQLFAALDRLHATRVTTNIRLNGCKHDYTFHWISEWKRSRGADGKYYGVDMVIPEWLYSGVLDNK